MHYLDAHTHVHFPAYDSDKDEVISRAKSADVKMITVGTQFSTSEGAIKISHAYPQDIWATVGYHPSHAEEENWYHDKNEQDHSEKEVYDEKKFLVLARDPKVVAIGECGLDYFRIKKEETKTRQKEIFISQIQIAKALDKPLMIHCREAFKDLIEILKTEGKDLKPGIVHFFTGTLEDTKELLDLGYSFTFGGVVTFTRDYYEQIKLAGSNRILSETDAPYVAPEPFRGKRNEPAYVTHTVKKLVEILGMEEEMLKEQIWSNALRVFGII